MFCKNCGNQIADGTAFCGVCGAKIAAATANEQPSAAETPVESAAPAENPTVTENPVNGGVPAGQATNGYYVPNSAPSSNPTPATPKKFPKKLLFIGLPIVAVIVVVALCFNTLSGLFIKTFASNSSYLAYVEANSIGGYTDVVTGFYGTNLDSLEGIGVEGDIVLEVGESLTSLLSANLNGMDLSWLKQAQLHMDVDSTGNKTSGTMALTLSDKTILTVEFIMDTENGVMYLRSEELNDKYIAIEIPDMSRYGMTTIAATNGNSTSTIFEKIAELADKLPTEDALNKLIEKYVGVALKQITDNYVTKESGEITANGVTESCTVLEVKVTEKLIYDIVKAILTEAEKDDDIIGILEELQKAAEEIDASAANENIVDEYKNSVADGLAELDEEIAELQGEGEEYFILTDYVNGSHEIIGRELSTGALKDKISILSAKDGSDVGYEFIIGEVAFTGKGTQSGDAFTGSCSLVVDNNEYFKIELEDFNASNVENGEISGAVVLKLGSGASRLMNSQAYSAVALLNPSVRLELDISESKAEYVISVLTGENLLAKLAVSGEETSVSVLNVPDADDTLKAAEIDPSDFDINKVIENLEDAGVPESLLNMLQGYIAG